MRTMTVTELIEKLKDFPPDTLVCTEGEEQLWLNTPNPRIEYYHERGEGPNTPTYGTETTTYYPSKGITYEQKLTPVVLL